MKKLTGWRYKQTTNLSYLHNSVLYIIVLIIFVFFWLRAYNDINFELEISATNRLVCYFLLGHLSVSC